MIDTSTAIKRLFKCRANWILLMIAEATSHTPQSLVRVKSGEKKKGKKKVARYFSKERERKRNIYITSSNWSRLVKKKRTRTQPSAITWYWKVAWLRLANHSRATKINNRSTSCVFFTWLFLVSQRRQQSPFLYTKILLFRMRMNIVAV